MGDPSEFQILGGANPHTRTRWGIRKTVDRAKARVQWDRLAGVLRDLGVDVYVVPSSASSPGLVFPANAGFLTRALEPLPLEDKTFVLSHSTPSRSAERGLYGGFLRGLGFSTRTFPTRFEGEADLFPAGDYFLFTSGPIEKQRFVPAWGWPPYRRVYGFRSSLEALEELTPLGEGKPVLPLRLVRETHYHGDTCLCAFGKNREFLMAYLPALSDNSRERLKETFGDRLLPLSEADGELFSANAFQVDAPDPVLLLPHTASEVLKDQIRERGVRPLPVDVSEFMQKGGGSVKCMIGELGLMPAAPAAPEVAAFRRKHLYGRKGE
jgi:N-dimethylarginine dimethylaminohydrolase